ncbi:ATP-dependent RNA helicase DbpA [Mobilisporobacter senegalensis]|uniref:ATP-dependent RNA helicase DbpA n=1 Tax=Mobilisporobacter senegalensis TaxID=1329262 RepID=A0A3N1XTG8_9FIRM|nr:DEAD/DEAH box helicase [Mobilisporobacter senegalensis]ROR28462.1 ATP-dependent RNA helicase DbpA [Mobilisporobacter senegalensis]
MTKISFTNYLLSTETTNALNDLGYKEPTNVQDKVIPLMLAKKDLVVKSQTGSGKTAAYGIPICELVDWKENKPQALVLTPTRELAYQVKEDFINIGRYKRIKAAAIFGRQPFSAQKLELKQKTHVVVGTPGRVIDHIERGSIALEKIDFLVIDEADKMLNMGFIEQVEAIISHLPKERVTCIFSATLPERIKKLTQYYMNTPLNVEINGTDLITDNIEHSLYRVSEVNKLSLLTDITVIQNPDSCIIFCNTKDRVDNVYNELKAAGYSCNKLHGGMEQKDRLKIMKAFKRGEFRYLIATDVAARGIDIDNISLVINYEISMEKENYVHRIGRTGRAGREGRAITFVTTKEERYLHDIEEYIGFDIPVMSIPLEEEVLDKKSDFKAKMKVLPTIRKLKSEQLNKKIMKLYFNGGKKKNLRAIDFVGTIAKIEGVTAEDIGIITIMDTMTYVEILNGKGELVLKTMKETTIKGKMLKISKAKKITK